MKLPVAIILLVLGAFLVFSGLSRRDSLVGRADSVGKDIANTFDGGARTPRHYIYIAAGAVCLLAGGSMLFRRGGARGI